MSKGARIGYGILVLVSLLLSLVALFTPGWRSYKGEGSPDFGIVTYNCGSGPRKVNDWDCRKWAASKAPFEKVTLAFMILSCIFQFLALGSFFALFTRIPAQLPALTLAFLAFVSIFVAVIIYGVRCSNKVAYMLSQSYELLADVRLGYSYWIAVFASILLFFASGASGGLLTPRQEPY